MKIFRTVQKKLLRISFERNQSAFDCMKLILRIMIKFVLLIVAYFAYLLYVAICDSQMFQKSTWNRFS